MIERRPGDLGDSDWFQQGPTGRGLYHITV